MSGGPQLATRFPCMPRVAFQHQSPTTTSKRVKRPSNYFLAGNAAQMVDGLTQAFTSIAASVNAFTTAILSRQRVHQRWHHLIFGQLWQRALVGSIKAATLSFGSNGAELTDIWTNVTSLANQLAASGWNTDRRVVTWNKDHDRGARGVPFRLNSISASIVGPGYQLCPR